MQKDQPLYNPNIKNALVNVDLDLQSKLNQDHNQEQKILAENPLEIEQPIIELEIESQTDSNSNDIIPVAYSILADKKSFLDMILTPWGISAIILFFLANAIIFINLEPESQTVTNLQSEAEKSSEVAFPKGEKESTSQVLSTQEVESETNSFSLTNNDKTNQISSPLHQNLLSKGANIPHPLPLPPSPPSLTTLNNSAPPQVIVNQQLSPYPDLATALLSNLPQEPQNKRNYQENYSLQPVALPPPPPVEITPNFSPPSNPESISQNAQYSVIIEYNGMESFEQIQTAFPDALITNIGEKIKIQLAVFDNENEANKLIQKLQEKQITAYTYTSPSPEQ